MKLSALVVVLMCTKPRLMFIVLAAAAGFTWPRMCDYANPPSRLEGSDTQFSLKMGLGPGLGDR